MAFTFARPQPMGVDVTKARYYLVALLLLATPIFGRLGDTKAEPVERLGPVRTTSKHIVTAQGKIIPLCDGGGG